MFFPNVIKIVFEKSAIISLVVLRIDQLSELLISICLIKSISYELVVGKMFQSFKVMVN
jgi:hypothetical protein